MFDSTLDRRCSSPPSSYTTLVKCPANCRLSAPSQLAEFTQRSAGCVFTTDELDQSSPLLRRLPDSVAIDEARQDVVDLATWVRHTQSIPRLQSEQLSVVVQIYDSRLPGFMPTCCYLKVSLTMTRPTCATTAHDLALPLVPVDRANGAPSKVGSLGPWRAILRPPRQRSGRVPS